MQKTRFILLVLVLALGYGHLWLLDSSLDIATTSRVVLHSVGGILWLSAAVILVFSLFRIDRSADGSLCYDPANPYWKFMKWAYQDKWSERIPLCKSYWLTVGVIAIGVGCIMLLGVLGFVLYGVVYMVMAGQGLQLLGILGGSAVGAALLLGLLYVVISLWEKFRLFRYGFSSLLVVGFLYIVQLVVRVLIASMPPPEERVAVATTGGFWLLGIVVAIALIIIAFKVVPFLKNTWLGFYLSKAKKFMCPDLVACPVRIQQN